MSEHVLKTWPVPFDAVASGEKTHEVRVNDRDFKTGDVLVLRRYDPATAIYTGESCRVRVTHITSGGSWGLPPNLCVLSIQMIRPLDNILKSMAQHTRDNPTHGHDTDFFSLDREAQIALLGRVFAAGVPTASYFICDGCEKSFSHNVCCPTCDTPDDRPTLRRVPGTSPADWLALSLPWPVPEGWSWVRARVALAEALAWRVGQAGAEGDRRIRRCVEEARRG